MTGNIVLTAAILIGVVAVVLGLDALGVRAQREPSWQEVERQKFHAVCTSKGGTVVWNNRNWECLK